MLTDLECRQAKPGTKDRKLADRNGLYLFVTTTGFKSWRWKYRLDKKEKRLVLGTYPDMKAGAARTARDSANALLKRGIDPAAAQKAAITEADTEKLRTFEVVAREWYELQKPAWSAHHADVIMANFKDWVFPALGKKPISAITSTMVLELIRMIEARPAVDTARRIRQRISGVFSYGIAKGYISSDPATPIKAIMAPLIKGRRPALTDIEQLRAFLRAAEASPAHPSTKLASRFLALTAVRPDVVRWAVRGELEALDSPEPLWRIPATRMKLSLERKRSGDRFEFLVPLSRQAADVLAAVKVMYGDRSILFPSTRDVTRPISENAIGYFYNRLQAWSGRHVPHGWRASFSTIMNERVKAQGRDKDREIIDLMLAHISQADESIYNRALYLPRRREIAQEWADILLADFPPASSLLVGPRG